MHPVVTYPEDFNSFKTSKTDLTFKNQCDDRHKGFSERDSKPLRALIINWINIILRKMA